MAKEALSSGDKILSENYLQHVDHFTRIISHKNLSQSNFKENITSDAPAASTNPASSDVDNNQTKDKK